MKICVLGLGYIGLSTALMFAKTGVIVHGVDINHAVVQSLANKDFFSHEPMLQDLYSEAVEKGNFTVSEQPVEADVFIIAVQTPVQTDKTANLNYVKHAARMILPYLRKDNLIILESTVPPKTVEQVLLPIFSQVNYVIGDELFLAYCPERVYPGKLIEELVCNNRIVGGINGKSGQMAADLYKRFVKGNIYVTDVLTAEMAKLLENAYRDLNIAFANELARIAEHIGFNVWEAINLANSHSRVHIHQPGPGVGGHCIAVDPWFIVEKAPTESKLISLARNINDGTPVTIVSKIEEMVKDAAQPVITLFGLAFKGNVDDMREAPSLVIINKLRKKGYNLRIYDPLIKQNVEGKVNTVEDAVTGSDCLVILTDHDEFKRIDYKNVCELLRTKNIFDTRNILNESDIPRQGVKLSKIGGPLVHDVGNVN